MIVVDSSVWIDFFNGRATLATRFFKDHLGEEIFALGDLMLAEILQGFSKDKDFKQANRLLADFPLLAMGGKEIAVDAAQCYRRLRKKGLTLRGTIDAMIGAYCLHHDLPLLYSDRDFDVMAKHLGLRTVLERLH